MRDKQTLEWDLEGLLVADPTPTKEECRNASAYVCWDMIIIIFLTFIFPGNVDPAHVR